MTLFRIVLAIPAVLVMYPLALSLLLIAVFLWFAALVQGRVPEGMRDLGAAAIRYNGQLSAYVLLVTSRYPYSSPALVSPSPEAAPEPIQAGVSY